MKQGDAPLFVFVARDGEPLAPLREALTTQGAESLLVDQIEHARKLLDARDVAAVLFDTEGYGKAYVVMLCELVAAARTPVVLLGTDCEEIDQIIGLELGAADFLPRSSTPRLVLAKLRRLLAARTSPVTEAAAVTIGVLTLDRATRGVRVGDVLLIADHARIRPAVPAGPVPWPAARSRHHRPPPARPRERRRARHRYRGVADPAQADRGRDHVGAHRHALRARVPAASGPGRRRGRTQAAGSAARRRCRTARADAGGAVRSRLNRAPPGRYISTMSNCSW
jgi:CheY-like chemotaxis protein